MPVSASRAALIGRVDAAVLVGIDLGEHLSRSGLAFGRGQLAVAIGVIAWILSADDDAGIQGRTAA